MVVTGTKPPAKTPPGTVADTVIDLEPHMIVTDQDLDELYGSVSPRYDKPPTQAQTFLRSVLDVILLPFGLFGLFNPPRDNNPANISLFQDDDFEHAKFSVTKAHGSDLDLAPRRDTVDVTRPRDQATSKGFILTFTGVFGCCLLGAFLWFSEKARTAVTDTFTVTRERVVTFAIPAPALGQGLDQKDVIARHDVRNGEDYLIVEGLIANTTKHAVALPLLKVALMDVGGKQMLSSTHTFSKTSLGPDETTPFSVGFKNPPSNARLTMIEFVAIPNEAR